MLEPVGEAVVTWAILFSSIGNRLQRWYSYSESHLRILRSRQPASSQCW